MTKALRILAICAIAAALSVANGAVLMIDDFTVNQTLTASASSVVAAGWGGQRIVDFQKLTGAGTDTLNVNSQTPGWAVINPDNGNTVTADFWWDGNTTKNTFGAPVGVSASFSPYIEFVIRYNSDQPGNTITVTVYNGTGVYADRQFTLAAGNATQELLFTSFTPHNGFSWANPIQGVQMFVALTPVASNDMSIDFIEATDAPEPATLALIGSALLGLGLWRRKKLA